MSFYFQSSLLYSFSFNHSPVPSDHLLQINSHEAISLSLGQLAPGLRSLLHTISDDDITPSINLGRVSLDILPLHLKISFGSKDSTDKLTGSHPPKPVNPLVPLPNASPPTPPPPPTPTSEPDTLPEPLSYKLVEYYMALRTFFAISHCRNLMRRRDILMMNKSISQAISLQRLQKIL